MKEPISDKTVILIIISTILMIFIIAFLINSGQGVYDRQIEWRESNTIDQIGFNI